MKWFKHYSDAGDNLKLKIIRREFGLEGYGFYWLCLELVASQSEEYRINKDKEWKTELAISSSFGQELIEKILSRFADLNLIDKKSFIRGHLYLPKMAEYSDEYTSKLRRVSGHSRDNVRLEEIRTEEIRTDKKRVDKPQNHFSYLENIPEEDLNEFTFRFDASKHQVKSKGEDLANYCRANGKTQKYKDFKAFLVNALKKDFKELTEKQRKERESNQPRIEATIKKMSESKVDSDVGTPETVNQEKLKDLQDKRKNLLNKVKV